MRWTETLAKTTTPVECHHQERREDQRPIRRWAFPHLLGTHLPIATRGEATWWENAGGPRVLVDADREKRMGGGEYDHQGGAESRSGEVNSDG